MPFRGAKADLRNSWKPTAPKVERFCDYQITKSGDPAQEIIRFLVMCPLYSTFGAVGFLEFLRFASAPQNGICAFVRLTAVPLLRAPIGKRPIPLPLSVPSYRYSERYHPQRYSRGQISPTRLNAENPVVIAA